MLLLYFWPDPPFLAAAALVSARIRAALSASSRWAAAFASPHVVAVLEACCPGAVETVVMMAAAAPTRFAVSLLTVSVPGGRHKAPGRQGHRRRILGPDSWISTMSPVIRC